ncbi:MAG TPA: tachylectin-related carbohydrate-binding protein [Myxococcota bacterium]|nr:tachylectin-related carbohydrate-binding protein [Myxococcota bacterium]
MAKITIIGRDFPGDSVLEVRISGGDDLFFPIRSGSSDTWTRPDDQTLQLTMRWQRLEGTVSWNGGSGKDEEYFFDQRFRDPEDLGSFEVSFDFKTLRGRGFTFAYVKGEQKVGRAVIDRYLDGIRRTHRDARNRPMCYIEQTRLMVVGSVAGDSIALGALNGLPLRPRFRSYFIQPILAPAAMEDSDAPPPATGSFGHVIAGRNGTLYLLQGDRLLRYRHLGFTDGTTGFHGPVELSDSWAGARATLASNEGVLYRVMADGTLYWYQDRGHAGSGEGWSNGGVGILIGGGWDQYVGIMAGDDGVLYGLSPGGDLYWFRHASHTSVATTGRPDWQHGGASVLVKSGWQGTTWCGGSSNGVIYRRHTDGSLHWNQHTGFADGTPTWGAATPVGDGWQDFEALTASNDGVLYAVHRSGILSWYRHDGFADGSKSWRIVQEIGQGWVP